MPTPSWETIWPRANVDWTSSNIAEIIGKWWDNDENMMNKMKEHDENMMEHDVKIMEKT